MLDHAEGAVGVLRYQQHQGLELVKVSLALQIETTSRGRANFGNRECANLVAKQSLTNLEVIFVQHSRLGRVRVMVDQLRLLRVWVNDPREIEGSATLPARDACCEALELCENKFDTLKVLWVNEINAQL